MQVLKKGEKLGCGGSGHGRLTIWTFGGVEYFLGGNYFWENASASERGPCPYFCAGKLNAGEVATLLGEKSLD